VLTEHEIQIVGAAVHEGFASHPAADQMDEGMDSTKFSGNRLRRRVDRTPIAQIHHGGEEAILWQIQVTRQSIQLGLIVIE
jgi:hypothetical protein